MHLTYRGVQYQPKTIGEITLPAEEIGIYRGAKCQLRKLECPPIVTGFALLKYRGVIYRSPRYAQNMPTASKTKTVPVQDNVTAMPESATVSPIL